eukprot:2152997-Amphidinium_carterae.3
MQPPRAPCVRVDDILNGMARWSDQTMNCHLLIPEAKVNLILRINACATVTRGSSIFTCMQGE